MSGGSQRDESTWASSAYMRRRDKPEDSAFAVKQTTTKYIDFR
jgi:hypothetical protein